MAEPRTLLISVMVVITALLVAENSLKNSLSNAAICFSVKSICSTSCLIWKEKEFNAKEMPMDCSAADLMDCVFSLPNFPRLALCKKLVNFVVEISTKSSGGGDIK